MVDYQIKDGQLLLARLAQNGIRVTVAGWINAREDGQWFLYLATPLVDAEGITEAYHRVYSVFRQVPLPFALDPLEIKLIDAHEPLATALASVREYHPGPRAVWLRDQRLGPLSVQEMYVYPPADAARPAEAPGNIA